MRAFQQLVSVRVRRVSNIPSIGGGRRRGEGGKGTGVEVRENKKLEEDEEEKEEKGVEKMGSEQGKQRD